MFFQTSKTVGENELMYVKALNIKGFSFHLSQSIVTCKNTTFLKISL